MVLLLTATPSLSYAPEARLHWERHIVRPKRVWAMHITYISMAKGFVYLAVVLDWFSRPVASVHHNEGLVLHRGLRKRSPGRGSRRSAIQIEALSSRARPSTASSLRSALRSAWTARARGGTTCSSSGTRRSTCMPTRACRRRGPRSGGI